MTVNCPSPIKHSDVLTSYGVLQEFFDHSDCHISPEETRNILEDAIKNTMARDRYWEDHHFSRCHKLPLPVLTDFIFGLQSANLKIQITRFANYDPDLTFSKSSLTEARKKVSSKFFSGYFS